MAIYRLSSLDGIPESDNRLLSDPEFREEIVNKYDDLVREMEEGEYDITPKSFPDLRYKYNLLVSGGGIAVMRIIPRNEDSMPDRLSELELAGKLIKIPEACNEVFITGPYKKEGNVTEKLALFELIFWKD